MKSEVSKEQIHDFLSGVNSLEKIIKMEIGYNDEKIIIIYRDENDIKKVKHVPFHPFCWAKTSAARSLFGGDRIKIKNKLSEYGIECIGLRTNNSEGVTPERMKNGYKVMFRARNAMSYSKFMDFFEEGGRPLYPKKEGDKKEYIVVRPDEQFMIYTGNRYFRGYDDYDDLLRMQFDLETEGLNPTKDAISQIGIRTNRGYEKIIPVTGDGEEKLKNEIKALREFFQIIKEIKPDVISGHNTENFDWYFIDERLKVRGSSLQDFTESIFPHSGIYKHNRQKVLKMGGEMEYYYPTIMWGTNITDSLFAVRRAQALNSNIKKADLKYITKFAKLNKPNRVYVPGKIINETWLNTKKRYAHNDINGKWFKVTKTLLNKQYTDNNGVTQMKYTVLQNGEDVTLTDNETNEKYNIVTGTYIVERYLLDDLYETDKVELSFNQTNFQITKMIPVSYEKMATMGTAAVWKYIMMAWSYENNLAIPELIHSKPFTGGLSRLLVTGYIDNIIKLDYNSLYPSIILTHEINTDIDIMGTMSSMLEYVLTKREEYKGEKKSADKKVREIREILENNPKDIALQTELNRYKSKYELFDNMQSAIKVIGNGFFGSYGSGSVFPWSDINCAEETTCTGRMALRLMIGWFTNKGYRPLVGDSFTGDTPLFVKDNKSGLIDIKPISELIEENEISIDILGREYDISKKNYKVLCRSGWEEPYYIYRHTTKKPIYRVSDKETVVDVTEDHSLFDSEQRKIKPSEIKEETKLEYYNKQIHTNLYTITNKGQIDLLAKCSAKFGIKIPLKILNADKETRELFIHYLDQYLTKEVNIQNYTKTFVAGYNFIKK